MSEMKPIEIDNVRIPFKLTELDQKKSYILYVGDENHPISSPEIEIIRKAIKKIYSKAPNMMITNIPIKAE